jgi:hypothetical protein
MNEELQKGEAKYEELNKRLNLEPAQNGKYIAIDLASGTYEIGYSREEAVDKIVKIVPGCIPYTRKIGMVESVSQHYLGPKGNNARILRYC